MRQDCGGISDKATVFEVKHTVQRIHSHAAAQQRALIFPCASLPWCMMTRCPVVATEGKGVERATRRFEIGHLQVTMASVTETQPVLLARLSQAHTSGITVNIYNFPPMASPQTSCRRRRPIAPPSDWLFPRRPHP